MRIRYRELVNRLVVTADGRKVGRIADLTAEPRGERLCVTTLLVGPSALLQRIAFKRSRLFQFIPARAIAWSLVADVGDVVTLRVTAAELPRATTHDRQLADNPEAAP